MPPPPAILISPADPRRPEIVRLIAALDAYLEALYPPESNHLLDIDALCAPNIRFFAARRDEVVLGCGALRLEPGYAEVKRMFVLPEARGQKLGLRILERLEAQAHGEHLRLLRLETGVAQHEAIALYRRAGYVERAPFGEYKPDPLSLFMEKALA